VGGQQVGTGLVSKPSQGEAIVHVDVPEQWTGEDITSVTFPQTSGNDAWRLQNMRVKLSDGAWSSNFVVAGTTQAWTNLGTAEKTLVVV